MVHHLGSRLAMMVRIDLVQTMCQHAHCLITIRQGLTMGIDIYTIGQSADNQHVRTMAFQVTYEVTYQVLSVNGHLACSHNTHNLRLVQVAITSIIEYQRGIRTFAEPLRIVFIVQSQSSDTMLLHIMKFKICPFHRIIPVLEGRHQMGRGLLDDVSNLVPMFKQQLGTTHSPIQLQSLLIIEVCQSRQRHRIK